MEGVKGTGEAGGEDKERSGTAAALKPPPRPRKQRSDKAAEGGRRARKAHQMQAGGMALDKCVRVRFLDENGGDASQSGSANVASSNLAPEESFGPMVPKIERELEAWAKDFARHALKQAGPSLRVLVWGPSLAAQIADDDRRMLQDKRRTIVQTLRELGHVAATSEELVERAAQSPEFDGITEQPVHQIEANQLQEADFVIVLLGPPGTIAEVAGLLTSRAFAGRSAVFYDAEGVAGSYMEAGPLKNLKALGVAHVYDHDDLKTCCLAGAAVEFVKDQAASLGGTSPSDS